MPDVSAGEKRRGGMHLFSALLQKQGAVPHEQRPMTTSMFMLRCVELGLNIADLDLLTIGSVNDMFNEKSRDSMEWREEASQADMNRF